MNDSDFCPQIISMQNVANMSAECLTPEVVDPNAVHICVDMQRLFGPGSPWAVPWLEKALDPISRLVSHNPTRTIFTRFIPPQNAESARGAWRTYYEKWSDLTLDRLDTQWLQLAGTLDAFVPPAKVVDKYVYSPWADGRLDNVLSGRGVSTLIVSGGETEICVLATVLGAIDRGYQIVLVRDGLCSVMDETHDAIMQVYAKRFSTHLSIGTTEEILSLWH